MLLPEKPKPLSRDAEGHQEARSSWDSSFTTLQTFSNPLILQIRLQ